MVAKLKRTSSGLVVVLMTMLPGAGVVAQSSPEVEITVGVRPQSVRVGDAFTVTVRVVARLLPDAVDLEPGAAAELLGFEDRSSTRLGPAGVQHFVFQRDFSLVARAPGPLQLPGVLVDIGGETIEAEIPAVTAAPAGLQWGTPGGSPRSDRGREPRLLPEGVPPASAGRTYDRTQPQAYPYGFPGTALDPRWGTLGSPPLGPGLDSGCRLRARRGAIRRLGGPRRCRRLSRRGRLWRLWRVRPPASGRGVGGDCACGSVVA